MKQTHGMTQESDTKSAVSGRELPQVPKTACGGTRGSRRVTNTVIEPEGNSSAPWMIARLFRAIAGISIAVEHLPPEGDATLVLRVGHDLPSTGMHLESFDGCPRRDTGGPMPVHDEELVHHEVGIYTIGQP